MGVGDFGVSNAGSGYTYSTTQFLGTSLVRSWTTQTCGTCGAGGNYVSMQLNVVVVFTHGSTTRTYWIQDVPFYNTSNGYFDVENNIWNMSGSSSLASGSVVGNGTIYSGEVYIDDANGATPGTNVYLKAPVNISAKVVSSNASGVARVAFLYEDGYGWRTYDNVSFPWTSGWSDHGFEVNGNSYNGLGLYDDAEWIIGGPGDGSSTATTVANLTYALDYWNGHNFEAVPYAYDFGSDTAESVSNTVVSLPGGSSPGLPLGQVKVGSGGLHRLWNLTGLATLNVTPTDASGVVSLRGVSVPYLGGNANLTVLPGSYRVEQLNGTWVAAGENVTLTAAHYVHVNLPWVTASPGQGPAGTSVNVTGSHYPSGTSVTVALGQGGATLCSATTNSSGDFNCTAKVPRLAAARYGMAGTEATGAGAYAQAPFLLTTNLSVTESSSLSAAEAGINVTFRASASGGFAPYESYLWTFGDGSNATTSAPTVTYRYGGAGSFTARVTVADAAGSEANGSTVVRVNARPVVTSLSVDPSSADVGQNATFTAHASQGTPPYTSYDWLGAPTGCLASSGPTLTCTFLVAGRVHLEVTVTDSLGVSSAVSAVLSYPVYDDPTVTTPTADPPDADLGQTVTFQTTGTPGSGGPTFHWSGLPPGCSGNTATVQCIPDEAGTFAMTVGVTDSNGVSGSSPGTLSFTVFPDPTLPVVPRLSSPSADVGQPLTITAVATNGSGGFTYAWKGLPVGCEPANSSKIGCRPSLEGLYQVNVTATDTNGLSASLDFAYQVLPKLLVAGPTAGLATTDVGHAVNLSALAVGGAGGYRYNWSGLPPGCGSDRPSFACTPTASGNYTISVGVGDANGQSANGTLLRLVVNPSPRVGSVTASPTSLIVGQSLALKVAASGGTGNLSYNWSGLPPGCFGVSPASLACSPTGAGTFDVEVVVTDALGESANGTVVVSVGPAFLGLPAWEGYALLAAVAAVVVAAAALLILRPRRSAPTPPAAPGARGTRR
jgi:hypothetical protein